MTGVGTVIKLQGNTCLVRVPRETACGHDCGECRLCDNPDIEAAVLNPIGAKVGDKVKISQSTSKVLFSAFLLYILPIIGALLVYVLVSSFTKAGLYTVISEVLWLALWYLFIRSYSGRNMTMSIITEVVSNEAN